MVTRRLQAEDRTGSVRRPKTGVLPTVLRNQPAAVEAGTHKRAAVTPADVVFVPTLCAVVPRDVCPALWTFVLVAPLRCATRRALDPTQTYSQTRQCGSCLQGGPKKVSHILTNITMSNLNGFSQFFQHSKENYRKLSTKLMLVKSSID